MAEWPTVEAVKLSLGVDPDNHSRDSLIASAVQASIEQVAVDLGYQDIEVSEESDSGDAGQFVLTAALYDPETGESAEAQEIEPSNSLSNAALILAVMVTKAPDAPYGIAAAFDLGAVRVAANHPTYTKMLTGQRLRFGVG